ncbi:hypothetical protein IPF86_03855 [Candidatus Nomurabacteria bacterium]|nr:MAG: hypothetical protein IPF86_03855 [Candidatus Nomurabacteria bacterium]
MSYERLLFILGLWVAALPFLGFPITIRKILFVVTGFGIALIAYIFYKRSLRRRSTSMRSVKEIIEETS